MDKNILRKIQNCQLDMALEVKRLCNNHNLRYFLSYGSMLGAVRHGGFIPWDDDLDISMPRTDYEEFLRICLDELHSDYQMVTWENDRGYGNVYAKMMIKGSIFEEEDMKNVKTTKGIFIDIFPLDNFPSGNTYLIRKKIKILRFLLYCKCNYQFRMYGKAYKLFVPLLRLVLCLVPKSVICKLLELFEKTYNSEDCDKVIGYNAGTKGNDWIWKKDLEDLIEVDVEGYRLNILKNYDDFLSHYYGDYMTPPPPEQRENRHGIGKIDFGSYTIKFPFK